MSDDLFSVAGKVAVVTGGLGQLGAEISAALAARGAKVAIFDVGEEPRAGVADLSAGRANGSIRLYQVDVTDRDSIEAGLSAAISDLGAPTILVNNAGLDSPPDAPAEEVGSFEGVPIEAIERVLDVNVKGVLLCSQVVGGAMAAASGGSVINVSSIYGMLSPVQSIYDFRRAGGEEFFKPVAYSVSKSALYNLTRYLATYWAGQGVRVNTLTLAGIFNGQPAEFLDAYTARMPLGRMARADEAVGPVVFLASEASSYMTGANLVVDGGWSAW